MDPNSTQTPQPSVEQPITPTEPIQPQPADNQQPVAPKKSGGKKLLFLVLAIILVLGVISFTGLFVSGSLVSTSSDLSEESISEVSPTPVPLFLTINSPTSTTTVDGELLVSGTTLPNTTVVIYSNSDETTTVSNSQGAFEETVKVEGTDEVSVTAFSESGEEVTKTFTVNESL